MKISNTLVVGAGLLSTTSALTLRKRQDGGARVLGVDIARRTIGNPVKRDQARINRRSGTVQASLENEVGRHELAVMAELNLTFA